MKDSTIIIMCVYVKINNLITKYINKIVPYITEPIEFFYTAIYDQYVSNRFRLSIGCVPSNSTNIKIPHYIDWGFTPELAKNANEYVNTISIEEIRNKKFACLINRHDNGNTRTNIYNKLKNIGKIVCPSKLFNNFSNKEFENIGRLDFQKQFIFNICPENFVTKLDGYVTEKIWMACRSGNIPIYYGKLDDYDIKIFNMKRVIWFNPLSEESINETVEFVKELATNEEVLFTYYKQDIFLDTSAETFNFYTDDLNKRLNKFISENNL